MQGQNPNSPPIAPAATGNSTFDKIDVDQVLQLIVKIFSWTVLLPLSVIFSGIFLSNALPAMKSSQEAKNKFWIPLPPLLNVEARGSEVALGFGSFFVTFIVVTFAGGATFYKYAAQSFGIDPGQFNTLCFASGLFSVAWTSTIWLLVHLIGTPQSITEPEKQNETLHLIASKRQTP